MIGFSVASGDCRKIKNWGKSLGQGMRLGHRVFSRPRQDITLIFRTCYAWSMDDKCKASERLLQKGSKQVRKINPVVQCIDVWNAVLAIVKLKGECCATKSSTKIVLARS
jgi:hypothetical protein